MPSRLLCSIHHYNNERAEGRRLTGSHGSHSKAIWKPSESQSVELARSDPERAPKARESPKATCRFPDEYHFRLVLRALWVGIPYRE